MYPLQQEENDLGHFNWFLTTTQFISILKNPSEDSSWLNDFTDEMPPVDKKKQ